MYKLIIADDEDIILEGIAQQVNWKELGFEIVDTFSDGEEVIEFLNSVPVDVVLTDIMMTHIGGIDIARYIQESELFCKVVFVSGYKEFEQALQAIRYGVEDYILKPTKVEDLKRVFRKIKQELDNRARDIEFQKKVEKHWEELQPVMAEKFVGSLIMGALDDAKDIRQRMQVLYPEVDAGHCPCILAYMEIEAYNLFIQEKWKYSSEQFDDAVYNFIRIYKDSGYFHVVYKYRGKIRLFVIMKEYGLTPEENIQMCRFQIARFTDAFSEIFQTKVTVEIERIYQCINQVKDSQEDIAGIGIRQDKEELYLQEQKKMILTSIMMGSIGNAQKIMRSILKSLSVDDMRYRMNFVVDMFSSISDLLREKNPRLFEEIQSYIDYCNIMNMTTAEETVRYCDCIFEKMKSREGMTDQFDKNSLVDQIKAYVDNHIFEDIMLSSVADEIFISTTHLSRIFKKQTGETFLQYVTRKKMEKAVELLQDPQYKVYQIGESLGYKTPRYFSRLFFSFLGYYPNQYRKEVLKMGEDTDETPHE